MSMPYYDLVEPIAAWVTPVLGRLDYWGGVQRYIYNEQGMGYMIVPTAQDGDHSEETCFTTGNGLSPVSLFPNVSAFPDTPDNDDGNPCEVRGIACVSYTLRAPDYDPATGFDGNCKPAELSRSFPLQLSQPSMALRLLSVRSNFFHLFTLLSLFTRTHLPDTLFVDAASQVPLRFHFIGFNVVLGSHYDEYVFDYLKVIECEC